MKIDDSKVPGKENFPFPAKELSNRFIYEVLPDRSWKGHPCVVVGGGPSLSDFDWELLRGWRVIGVNRVYEKFDPTIIFSMDTRFLRWIMEAKYGEEARKKFTESKAYKTWLCTYNCKLPPEIYIVKVWKNYGAGFRAFPETMRNGIGHGNNSGFGALNLAVCLGANPIYLLGFDMRYEVKGEEFRTHWHGGHPQPHRPNTVTGFIDYFRLPAARAKELEINIINLCPGSALQCFPKMGREEIFH